MSAPGPFDRMRAWAASLRPEPAAPTPPAPEHGAGSLDEWPDESAPPELDENPMLHPGGCDCPRCALVPDDR